MDPTRVDRRRFLTKVSWAGGLAALPGAGSFAALAGDDERAHYDLDDDLVYLNHAAIGTLPRPVREARAELQRRCESNPAHYVWGDGFDAELAAARSSVAAALHASPDDVAVVRSTTEAFNLLASGLPLKPGDEVLYSTLNHAGASLCFEHRALQRGFQVRRFTHPATDIESDRSGQVLALYDEQISERTRLLVLPHLDNRFGVRHPIDRIAAQARRRGVEFIAVDGAQAIGMFDVDVPASGVDFYATSAHKWLQAPKGTGLLYVTEALRRQLDPMIVTWGQERWRGTARVYEDYGTRDPTALLALREAVRFHARVDWKARDQHLTKLRDAICRRVAADDRLELRSHRDAREGGALVAVGVRDASAVELAGRLLREHRVVVRGFDDAFGNALRVSPNLLNGTADVDRLFDALDDLL